MDHTARQNEVGRDEEDGRRLILSCEVHHVIVWAEAVPNLGRLLGGTFRVYPDAPVNHKNLCRRVPFTALVWIDRAVEHAVQRLRRHPVCRRGAKRKHTCGSSSIDTR